MESVKKTGRKKSPVAVKTEFEDSGDDDVKLCSLPKRAKFNFSDQGCNPMEEASPLGLNLKKSESFLDLIEKNLSQEKSEPSRKTLTRKEKNSSVTGGDKLKASNFPASLLKIGTWEYKSRYEGDLVAKCYFAKHKLVWEVLDGGLKNKIEIQWSDIMAIKANYPDNALETLDLVLARQPLFFREINPQPRKHTLWQATSDFTSGQATIFRRHFLEFPQGTLEKHFEKLTQCDDCLRYLSQQPEIVLDTPYFQPMVSIFGDHNHSLDWKSEMASGFQGFRDTISTSGFSSSDIENQDPIGTPSEHTSRRSAPFEDILRGEGNPISSNKINETESLTLLNQVKLPGLRESMSVGDFITHIGDCISEQMKSDDPNLHIDEDQRKDILDELSHYLLSDSQTTNTPVSDEKYIMSRVNSLCCLLQTGTQNLPIKPDNPLELRFGNKFNSIGESISDEKPGPSFARSDSVGEFLLQLPRIASLPRFLVNEGRE